MNTPFTGIVHEDGYYEVCQGKIGTDGRCEKCYQISQTTSGYCTRLILIPKEAKPEGRKFSLQEAIEIWEAGYDRGFKDGDEQETHLGSHRDSDFNWLDRKTYFKKLFNIDINQKD